MEFAISWQDIYIRRYQPWYRENGRNINIPPVVRIGPRVHCRIIYTNIIGYIIETAKEGRKFVINQVELQLLRAHSRAYLDVQRVYKNRNSDFFVYIEYFKQYLPGVVIEILILYFAKWNQWYPETKELSIYPKNWHTGSLIHWFCRFEVPNFEISYNRLGNWRVPNHLKQLLDIFETGIKALLNPELKSKFSNKRSREEE